MRVGHMANRLLLNYQGKKDSTSAHSSTHTALRSSLLTFVDMRLALEQGRKRLYLLSGEKLWQGVFLIVS